MAQPKVYNEFGMYPDRESVQSISLQKVLKTICIELPEYQLREMDLRVQFEYVSNSFVFVLKNFFAGQEEETTTETPGQTVYFPATWWDAVKQRWFPAWLEARFPVKFDFVTPVVRKTTKVTRICPHMDVPPGDRDHFEYLVYDRLPTNRPRNKSLDSR